MKLNTLNRFRLLALMAAPALLGGCAAKLDIATPSPGTTDFSTTVAIGGTVMSGYQDGALYREGQATSIPALIARQLALAGGGSFGQALMPSGVSLGNNPYPWVAPYQSRSHLGDATDCTGEVSLAPVKTNLSESDMAATDVWTRVGGTIRDFTVPGVDMWAMDRRDLGDDHLMGGPSVFASRFPFAGTHRSILEEAIAAHPSFVIYWPGIDEVWKWAGNGGHGLTLPSAGTFRQKLDSILTAFNAAGAKGGVLATIPDPSTMPFFTTIPGRALPLSAGAADSLNTLYNSGGIFLNFVKSTNGFIVQDPTSTYGIRQLTDDDMLLLSVPLDSMKCFKMGVLFTLIPDRCSLIASELLTLRTLISAYNAAIIELGQAHNFAVADMAGYYQQVKAGIRVDAVDFDSEFAAGGFFSLDGFGPNPKGAGLIANQFIAAINAQYDAVVPMVQIHQLNGVLFP